MNPNKLILAAVLALFSASNLLADTGKSKASPPTPAEQSMIVLEDFESGSWGDWTVEGSAFGRQPFTGNKPPQTLLGRKGEGAVNSWAVAGDGATGKLTSQPFEISKPFIGFLLGGGKAPEHVELGVRLEVDGQVERRATGNNSDAMEWVNWEVSELLGKTGRIIIEDASKDPWGHVVADHFVLSPVPMPTFAVASPFGDRMVLQREKPVVVWGRGLPGDRIRVTFAGQTKETQVDASNRWRVELDPMPASAEGRDLAIEQVGGEKVVFTDVLVGEVWLAGGQSNMGFALNGVLQAEKEMASANLPSLRIMQMPSRGSAEPLDMAGCTWEVATPKTIAGFSGVAFIFARSLIEKLGVPVGVILSSVGATAAEQWMPAEVLANDPEWKKTMVDELAEAERNARLVETFQQDLKAWRNENGCPEEDAVDHAWADPALDTSDWKPATVPFVFGTALDAPGGGYFWMRKDFDVPEDKAGKPATVVIGNLDRQFMHVFLNGENIGILGDKARMFYQAQGNRIALPGNLLKPGRNVLAIRCTVFDPASTFRQPAEKMELPVADPATLDGTWLLKAETLFPAVSREAIAALPNFGKATMMNVPTGLYNAMIHPLVPFTLRGVIWYQGESNAFKADRYKDLLTAMITEWRARFGQGDFPFYMVQLANYYDPVTEPVPTDRRTTDDWVARLREAQLQVVQSVPETGMAVAIDVGEKNIHPLNKQDVGDRLARLALAKTYGLKDVEHASPVYASMSREGAAIRVTFAVGTGGLMIASKSGLEPAKETPDAKLAQFAIAGADRKFVWAEATIDGSDAVIVSSPAVPEPVAVRYAWGLNPEGANLYGRNGLPASPFRTDDWPLPSNASPVANQTPERELQARWFREARFGLFIHWGVYSVPAGEWRDKKHPFYGEWIMESAKIPIADYKEFAKEFTASNYDPKAWADLAKEAGMKYVIITAKHHDGFALFDSEASDWNAVRASAAQRDLIAPLAEAVRANGLSFGLYYSQAQDWVNGGSFLFRKEGEDSWDPAQKTNFDDYLTNVSLPQVREILERYQPDILWWDTPAWMNKERARPFAELLKEKAPNMISNNRLGGNFPGDTATPEQHIPTRGMPGRMFEVCMTMNDTWGYKSYDNRWKSVGRLLRHLSDISSKGGNFLLNVGPTKEGEIPQPSIDRLKAMGRWMADYGEAIYGTEAGPYVRQLPWGRITKKVDDKGGVTLYLHVWEWPSDGRILLPGLSNQPISGRLLKGGAPLQSEPTAEGLVVTLPGQPTHEDISVVALVFKEPLTISGNSLPQADPQKPLTLSASEADCVGYEEANLRMEGQGEEAYWTDWNDPRFRLEYSVESKKAGKWKVSAEVAGEQPAKLWLTINNGKPPNPKTEVTPAGKLAWKTFDLGIIDLPAGFGSFAIRGVWDGWNPVDLRRVTLTPVQQERYKRCLSRRYHPTWRPCCANPLRSAGNT